MAFRFNFSDPDNSEETEEKRETIDLHSNSGGICVQPSKELLLKENKIVLPDTVSIIKHTFCTAEEDISICCYDNTAIETYLCDEKAHTSIAKAVTAHSDLVPNQYEGGLTVWECSIDLTEYITGHQSVVKDKTVLELGCGAGLPGLCAIQCGATHVTFQDYNSEVLEYYTMQNVRLLHKKLQCLCHFISGDWSELQNTLKFKKYNVILTAETIYNQQNYEKLHTVFENHLEKTGTVYLAAKSNYFGVGGGTQLFVDFVKRKGQFSTETCHQIETGVPRIIMQLKWIDKNSVS